MSLAQKGRTFTDETRKRMSDAQKGKKLTEDHKKKIGESNRGRIKTEEEREALRAYFDETTINLSSLIKKIGKDKVVLISKVIDKIYGN